MGEKLPQSLVNSLQGLAPEIRRPIYPVPVERLQPEHRVRVGVGVGVPCPLREDMPESSAPIPGRGENRGC